MVEPPLTRRRSEAAAVLAVAAGCWAITVHEMRGMNMGVGTGLGSFGFFAGAWVAMMAAMMLPGAAYVVARRSDVHPVAVAQFVLEYLAVWTVVGVATYPLYQPHSTRAAGVVILLAGAYELSPLKTFFRRRCNERARSGLDYGLCCVGSSIGLMMVLLAMGVMNLVWMAIIAAVVLLQKILAPRLARDVPFALAIVALGIWTLVDPSSIPGLVTHNMPAM